jgi:hypothetical protein
MAKGKKTGGRAKGTRNKSTAAVKDFVERVDSELAAREIEGYSSLDEVAVTLLTCGVPQVIERVWEKLMEYRYGKPVQPLSGPNDGPVKIVFDSIPRPRRR